MQRNDANDRQFFPAAAMFGDHTVASLRKMEADQQAAINRFRAVRDTFPLESDGRANAHRKVMRHSDYLGMIEDELRRRHEMPR